MIEFLNVYIGCVIIFEVIKFFAIANRLGEEELTIIEIWQNEEVNWFGKLLIFLGWFVLFPITFIISIIIILSKIGVKRMTKLEQKLIELGYETNNSIYKYWFKGQIVIQTFYGRLENYYIICPNNIHRQQDIDNLQQAFNQLQNDLKELKEYE